MSFGNKIICLYNVSLLLFLMFVSIFLHLLSGWCFVDWNLSLHLSALSIGYSLLKQRLGNFNTRSIVYSSLIMAGLTIDDLNAGIGPIDGFLYPPNGIGADMLPPIDWNTSQGTMYQNLLLQNQAMHRLKSVFDEHVDNMQAEYAQQLRILQDEQVRVRQENQTLQQRLNVMPSGPSTATSRLDCPSFGSDDEQVDARLKLHDYHTWQVQAVAWYVEATQSPSSKHVQLFTKLRDRAARVVTAKLSIEQLRSDGRFQALQAVLEWAHGDDSTDNIMRAVSDPLDCRRGDQDTLTWMNRLDTLVYRLGNSTSDYDYVCMYVCTCMP